MAHGHGPGRCRCCGEEAAERGAAWGLYLRIDRQRLQCLNERREGSGATVFRPWEERGDRSQVRPGAAVGSGGVGEQQGRNEILPLDSGLECNVRAWASQDRRRRWRGSSGGHRDDLGSGEETGERGSHQSIKYYQGVSEDGDKLCSVTG
ncbi:hypothetical protein Nmel_017609 [Mimus melanotis]